MNTNKGECHFTLFVHLLTVLLKLYLSSNIYFPPYYLIPLGGFSGIIKQIIGGTQCQFLENICSEDDLRSGIFGTFVVKFLASLPLLGFSNI